MLTGTAPVRMKKVGWSEGALELYNILTVKVLMGRSGVEWPCVVYPHGGKRARHLHSHIDKTQHVVGCRHDLGQEGSL